MEVVWVILQIAIGYHLAIPMLLYITYLLIKKQKAFIKNPGEADYAFIVTAYEQTDLLEQVVNSILNINYSNYLVYIVADKCDVSNLVFNDPKIYLLTPENTLSSNTRSHFYAINRFVRKHERLTIIDSDNLVDREYLQELNKFFDKGYLAVQGVREAKNLNTPYACLDAARDLYYHFYDGKVLFGLGSSATLAGSGMAFNTELYKQCLQHLDVIGAGFDKVLQFEIVKRGQRIAFAQNAIVYDEKTAKPDQLVKQRARWINTWFKYFSYGFKLIAEGVKTGSVNQLLFGFILLRPPLFIFLLSAVFCLFLNVFFSPVAAIIWTIGMVLFVAGFLIALVNTKIDSRIYSALISIPKFMFFQVLSLTKAHKANKISVATRHDYN
ncbi:MAG: glycosyltransferase family 2 protein [Bacteroidota bacterium]|nr:glycosyltransferase family 2 protein [Bacteroidota bacterium]